MKLDLKSLDVLEEKIQRAVRFANRVGDENAELQQRLRALESKAENTQDRSREVETLRLTQGQLEKELKTLQSERDTVIKRVDGILENLDTLPFD